MTSDFYDLVSDIDGNEWDGFSSISVKNMGNIGTYMLSVL